MQMAFKNIFIQFITLLVIPAAGAQFAPAAGLQGSTAISKDDLQFVEWANACSIERGYRDIAVPDSGYASVGDNNSAIGQAGQNGVVSLGDGGTATLTFQNPISNGPGFDFAVFENGFYTGDSIHAFLEFAFVEVSSDGNNFFRFPATSNIQDTVQLAMQGIDCSLVNNLAGKYVYGYGTPFDLDELRNEVGLNVNNITHVRVIDVVGSINNQYATRDQFGKKINDPYPTPYSSGGFDLDAVGVIHAVGVSGVNGLQMTGNKFQIYPNPSSFVTGVNLQMEKDLVGSTLKIYDVTGNLISEETLSALNCHLSTNHYSQGIYFLTIESFFQKFTAKMIIE